jgi:hypothetical protein
MKAILLLSTFVILLQAVAGLPAVEVLTSEVS